MNRALFVAVLACKSEPTPPSAPLALTAEVGPRATLVAGTRRFAIRADERWLEARDGALVENATLAAAVAREVAAGEGAADVFLGTTPIVVGGEHHHEVHVRVPDRVEVPLDGIAVEVVTLADGREVWRYEHELETRVAIVRGTQVSVQPAIARIGPDADTASPVSRAKCRHPQIRDLDATRTAAYALVVECSDAAPLRVLVYDAAVREIRVERILDPQAIAVARDGTITLAGVRDGALAIARLAADGTPTVTTGPAVSRVLAAATADDGAVWILAYTATGAIVTRDGAPVALQGSPSQLALDATLGVVVLAGHALYAERPRR